MTKKYKFLNYVPAPMKLDSSFYDLVNDDDFLKPHAFTNGGSISFYLHKRKRKKFAFGKINLSEIYKSK